MEYSKRILIVEDEPALRRLLNRLTKEQGLESDLAQDGRDAIDRITLLAEQNQSYPIISTDLTMPRMDGIELIEKIGELVGKKKILMPEVYILSGGHPRAERIDELKAYGLVRKTFGKPTSVMDYARELKSFYDSMGIQ